jgi:uncharacterized protein YbbK (DUF523 family)
LLNKNVEDLQRLQLLCEDKKVTTVIPELQLNINFNRTQVEYVEGKDWNRSRKMMRAVQNQVQSQQIQRSDQ